MCMYCVNYLMGATIRLSGFIQTTNLNWSPCTEKTHVGRPKLRKLQLISVYTVQIEFDS